MICISLHNRTIPKYEKSQKMVTFSHEVLLCMRKRACVCAHARIRLQSGYD